MTPEETMQMYEDIITLLKRHPSGLGTPQLKEKLAQIDQQYGKLSNKTILSRIKKLEQHAIRDVEVKQGKRRLPHRLIADRREEASPSVKAQLYGEEKAFLRLALQSIAQLPELSDKHLKAIEARFRLDTLNTPYFIESQDAETLDPSDSDVATLQHAIKEDYMTGFRYDDESSRDFYVVEPYKLIMFDGLWYLFGKDIDEKESSPYKTWRLKYIKDVEVETRSRHNTPDTVIERVLAKANDADFVVEDLHEGTMRSLSVKVWVDACIADEVRLPGFQSRTKPPSGEGYHITCTVSTTEEIDKDIKQWLPYIRVEEPLSYKEEFEAELVAYAKSVAK